MEDFIKPGKGFTLIEVLIVLALFGIIMSVVVGFFFKSQKIILKIDEINQTRTNLRGALFSIEDSIRMAGFSPKGEIPDSAAILKAWPGVFEFRKMKNSGLEEDVVSIALNREGDCGSSTCTKRDGIADKGSASIVLNSQNAADDIAALRFAYAFDNDEDGFIDTENNNIIWAVDSDNDNFLDISIDSNSDGIIDKKDSPEFLIPRVKIEKIRAVKVWVLARTHHQTGINTKKFILGAENSGKKILEYLPPENKYTYIELSTIVRCRNIGG